MGGTSDIDRLTLVPLRGLLASEIRDAFRAFDVRGAKCSVEETTQVLLGVVESGFGDLGVFNSLVRTIFAERVLDEEEGDAAPLVAAAELSRAPTRKASAVRKLSEPKVRVAGPQVV